MKTRVISGAVLLVIAVASCILGGPVLLGVMLFCSLFGLHELYRALGLEPEKFAPAPLCVPGYIGCVLYYAVMYLTGGDCGFLMGVLALVLMAVMTVYVLRFPKYKSEQALSAVFSFVYVVFMLGFVWQIRNTEEGLKVIWLVFLTSWIADTFAYFSGMAFGRHKMAPVLSPKKTIEGAAGGVAASGLAGVCYAFAVGSGPLFWRYALICMAGAVISIFGDLSASAIKRDRGIKDYSGLIPGHGGILDRFDSMIFTAPMIYFLLHLLIY